MQLVKIFCLQHDNKVDAQINDFINETHMRIQLITNTEYGVMVLFDDTN